MDKKSNPEAGREGGHAGPYIPNRDVVLRISVYGFTPASRLTVEPRGTPNENHFPTKESIPLLGFLFFPTPPLTSQHGNSDTATANTFFITSSHYIVTPKDFTYPSESIP